jgi:maltooligosyltrehalose trehalohydrolase
LEIGPCLFNDGRCTFTLWAPRAQQVELLLLGSTIQTLPMQSLRSGYWRKTVPDVGDGQQYAFYLNSRVQRADPASHSQPEGIHGPSEIIDHKRFTWDDQRWRGLPLQDFVVYELHVGAFSRGGRFQDVIGRLNDLVDLGVTAVEVMPVAAFPGVRNWGYDGVFPYAVQQSYGGPQGLKELVNACHQRGLAVILDVVYNHLGPEGNHFAEFGPYFTDQHQTPWGGAINFDGPASDDVRNYFIANALHWFEHYHLDALRIDAIQAIYDHSASPFLSELAGAIEAYSRRTDRRPRYLIAESDLNDERVIQPRSAQGLGLDACWCDDLHHAVHAFLTGERQGYYQDYGAWAQVAKAIREGFVFGGEFSRYRGRHYGNFTPEVQPGRLVVSTQNHDLAGNRLHGERTSRLLSFDALKLFAATVLLSPYVPLLFMGEEYGEIAPFLYFVDHGDLRLAEAVRRGREEEFRKFAWQGTPPDPGALETFERSRLHWEDRRQGQHAYLLAFYRSLLTLRRTVPALRIPGKENFQVRDWEAERIITCQRQQGDSAVWMCLGFNPESVAWTAEGPAGSWRKVLDAGDASWGGSGPSLPAGMPRSDKITLLPYTVAIYLKEPA